MENLPLPMIHHIQSYLSVKDAVRSCFISENWFRAWSTCGKLAFDESCFRTAAGNYDAQGFIFYVERMLQQYADLSVQVVRIVVNDLIAGEALLTTAAEWRVDDLTFQILEPIPPLRADAYVFPSRILELNHLRKLCLSDCRINGLISLRNLEELDVCRVVFLGDKNICGIMEDCQGIQKLKISECKIYRSPLLFEPLGSDVNSKVFTHLQILILDRVRIKRSFFTHFEVKFPRLKRLALWHPTGPPQQQLRIRSQSLEEIEIFQKHDFQGRFVVPTIQNFSYKGSKVPLLSFKEGTWVSRMDDGGEFGSFCHITIS